MLADDKEVYDYFNEVKGMPFLCGVQGEDANGRQLSRRKLWGFSITCLPTP